MTNAHIAQVFEQLADLLEFQGANPFRVRAYRNAARTISELREPVSAIVADPDRSLTEFEGFGKDLAEKVTTLVETGELPQLTKLLEEVPESVLTLLRIPGVGPKKAAMLHKQLGVATLDQLRAACESGQVRELKGFGRKTEQVILQGLSIAASADQRMLWAQADANAQQLREYLAKCVSVQQLELAGSYRRGKETIGDLDVLVVSQDVAAVMDHFALFENIADVIARGETKMSVRMDSGLQIDLRVVPAESFGAALQYFTGSKEHNVILRGLAKQRGLKINEYGVFRVSGKSETYIGGATEEEVYATLELPVFPPELREGRWEFEWAAQGPLPRLVELSDIRGDLHMHTTQTDGHATLEEMVQAARDRGLHYIAITDHSQRVTMARGLNPDRLLAQWEQIDTLNAQLGKRFTVLKGIECDILENGKMDLPDEILAQGDFVIASVHYGQRQTREQITNRILHAIENPHVAMIAHPTGRLLNRREAYEVDLDAVIQAAAKYGKLLELNANPMRLDLNDIHCAIARHHGVSIAINTDAHSTQGLDVMRYGILQARRGGLTPDQVANTRSWTNLEKLIGQPR